MRRLCATGLMLTLAWQPISAAGPLERSLLREASRVARESAAEVDPPGWRAVHLLEPGGKIVVTTEEGSRAGAFVAADGAAIAITRNGATEQINADAVLMIEKTTRRGSALAAVFGTLGGIWLGSGLAFGIADSSRCYEGCGGVRLAVWSTIIGFPIAGGYGAWRGSSRLVEEVVYRRSPRRP